MLCACLRKSLLCQRILAATVFPWFPYVAYGGSVFSRVAALAHHGLVPSGLKVYPGPLSPCERNPLGLVGRMGCDLFSLQLFFFSHLVKGKRCNVSSCLAVRRGMDRAVGGQVGSGTNKQPVSKVSRSCVQPCCIVLAPAMPVATQCWQDGCR